MFGHSTIWYLRGEKQVEERRSDTVRVGRLSDMGGVLSTRSSYHYKHCQTLEKVSIVAIVRDSRIVLARDFLEKQHKYVLASLRVLRDFFDVAHQVASAIRTRLHDPLTGGQVEEHIFLPP
jgi:hypothetical protein